MSCQAEKIQYSNELSLSICSRESEDEDLIVDEFFFEPS